MRFWHLLLTVSGIMLLIVVASVGAQLFHGGDDSPPRVGSEWSSGETRWHPSEPVVPTS